MVKGKKSSALAIVAVIIIGIIAIFIIYSLINSSIAKNKFEACNQSAFFYCNALASANVQQCNGDSGCESISKLSLAASTGDISLCVNITPGCTSCSDFCFAYVTGNIDYCSSINNTLDVKEDCANFILAKQNPGLCNNIQDIGEKDFCKIIATKNNQYCESYAEDLCGAKP